MPAKKTTTSKKVAIKATASSARESAMPRRRVAKPPAKSVMTTQVAKARRFVKGSSAAQPIQQIEAVVVNDFAALVPTKTAISEVSFTDAMRVIPLLSKVSKQAQFTLRGHLVSHGCDVLAGALGGASIIMNRGTMVVRFSEKGTKLLGAKELVLMKGGVPTLVDASGRIVENARLLGPLATSTRIAANLWMAAVTVAHIISGADIAKNINKLDAKVDFLVAGRRINQLARIEGVYRQACEILHLEQNSYTQWELHRMGRELFEVRSEWRREIAYHVGNVQKTEESDNWLVGFFQGLSRKGKDEKVAAAVSARDAEIQLISGSIAIHLALSQAAGTLDTFLQISLPDEIIELERVRSQIHERRDYIHEKHPALRDSVSAVCSQLDDVSRIYRPMIIPKNDASSSLHLHD